MANNYGLKVTLPGINVGSAGLKDLLFHSKYPLLKIQSKGSGSVNLTDGGAGFNIVVATHNLGYQPLFFLFSTYYDSFSNAMVNNYRRMPLAVRSSGGLLREYYTPTVNTTQLLYSGSTAGGDGLTHTINYYYVIYYEPQ